MNPIETLELNGWKAYLVHDPEPPNPREWEHCTQMLCWHKRYQLGDKHSLTPKQARELIQKTNAIHLPLFLYDHSGISMSWDGDRYPFNDTWNAGQVGYLIATAEAIQKEYGNNSAETRLRCLDLMKMEVEEYDDYLTGSCYGILVENPDGGKEETCWGFLGYDYAIRETQAMLDAAVQAGTGRIPDAQYVEQAVQMHSDTNTFEVPADPEVKRMEDGAWVQAWVWVSNLDLKKGDLPVSVHNGQDIID